MVSLKNTSSWCILKEFMAKITIFGLAGTGKSSTAKRLADILGYEFKSSGNMFREMAAEANMTLNEFEKVCQEDPNYDKMLDARVGEYGKTHDNFIFESRLAWYYIPDSFKVMLVCGETERIQRVAERENKTFEQVQNETLEREGSIYKRFKEYYDIDNINDTSHYNLIVDTQKNNLEEVVTLILAALAERGIVTTPQK